MGIPRTGPCSLNTPLSASANCSASATIFSTSLSLRPDEEAMVIDWSLPVALSFTNTLTMHIETISIGWDEQSNASTHFSQPSPICYNPIPARKHETPAVRSVSIRSRTSAPLRQRSRVGSDHWVFVHALLLPFSSSHLSVRCLVGSRTKFNTFCQ